MTALLELKDIARLDRPELADEVAQPQRSAMARRSFLRVLTVTGTAAGLGLLRVLPPMRAAYAAHVTYTIHSNCATISYAGTPSCQGCCTCGSSVSSGYCASNNWHRHDVECGSGYCVDYGIRTISCSGRNAWEWTLGSCCSSRVNRKYRCSDGMYRVDGGGGWGPWNSSVCPFQTSTGTAC